MKGAISILLILTAANCFSQAIKGTVAKGTYINANRAEITVTVTPDNQTITAGSTKQYTANVTYQTGETVTNPPGITWSSTNTAAATINSTGLATGVAQGSTNITATTAGGASDQASLTVNPSGPMLSSISLGSSPVTLGSNPTPQSITFVATGTYSDTSTQDITSQCAWTFSYVSGTNPNATETAATVTAVFNATGASTIFCTVSAINSNTVTINVAPTNPSSKKVPLTDLTSGNYMGLSGGLEGGGSNSIPSAQNSNASAIAATIQPLDMDGNPNGTLGYVVLISTGMSNTSDETAAWLSIFNSQVHHTAVLMQAAHASQPSPGWTWPPGVNSGSVGNCNFPYTGYCDEWMQASLKQIAGNQNNISKVPNSGTCGTSATSKAVTSIVGNGSGTLTVTMTTAIPTGMVVTGTNAGNYGAYALYLQSSSSTALSSYNGVWKVTNITGLTITLSATGNSGSNTENSGSAAKAGTLVTACVNPKTQVQAGWFKHADSLLGSPNFTNQGGSSPPRLSIQGFTGGAAFTGCTGGNIMQIEACKFEQDLGLIYRNAKVAFPNLQMVAASTRVYSFSTASNSTEVEPFTYEYGFSEQALMLARAAQWTSTGCTAGSPASCAVTGTVDPIAGDLRYWGTNPPAPFVWWGDATGIGHTTYIWANSDNADAGTYTTTVNAQGQTSCFGSTTQATTGTPVTPWAACNGTLQDYQSDGIHPSTCLLGQKCGASNIATMLDSFFKTSSFTTWYKN